MRLGTSVEPSPGASGRRVSAGALSQKLLCNRAPPPRWATPAWRPRRRPTPDDQADGSGREEPPFPRATVGATTTPHARLEALLFEAGRDGSDDFKLRGGSVVTTAATTLEEDHTVTTHSKRDAVLRRRAAMFRVFRRRRRRRGGTSLTRDDRAHRNERCSALRAFACLLLAGGSARHEVPAISPRGGFAVGARHLHEEDDDNPSAEGS